MGSGGLAFDANDGFSAARGNQKTVFVGTGTQIAALGVTYVGQRAYSTDTSAGFVIDNGYVRNAANNAWNIAFSPNAVLIESAELNSVTAVGNDTATSVTTAENRYYAYFTLPSTEFFYIITGIEWKNGTTIAGITSSGVDAVNASPPTLASTPLLACARDLTNAGAGIQRISDVSSSIIRAGTIIGVWIACDNATQDYREDTAAPSITHHKATTADQSIPNASENTAFAAANTTQKYIKVYYRGYE